ncbi:MAG: glutathione binding-like protein [Steroidobacteraceae bacterium]
MIENRLSGAIFFAGDEFTAADIMMCLMLVFATRETAPYPNIKAYLQRLDQRPGCRRARIKSEPDRPVPT